MKRITINALFCYLIICTFSPALLAVQQNKAQEKLDSILKINWSEGDFLRFLLHREGHSPTPNKYNDMFSKKLLKTLAKDEKQTIHETCGDEYHDGEICGMDFNPLTCSNQAYIVTSVNLLKQKEDLEIYEYLSNGNVVATYKMVKEPRGWVLDGISCANGKFFNLKLH